LDYYIIYKKLLLNEKNMPKKSHKIELLAPAGSPEKMLYAFAYGADAIYAGIPEVSMRARINSFTEKSLIEATEIAHKNGKKIFVTLNIYAHNYHLPTVESHLKFLKKIKVDAVIVSDPGIIMLVKKHAPEMEIHLSTQANTTNWQAAKFWYDLGVKRIVLAREVTLEDIKEIKKHVPKLELEYFVHGAMCMSYSGRCILSKWMSGKSANLGDCTQPCRWGYKEKIQISNDKLQTKERGCNYEKDAKEYKTMELEEAQKRHGMELEEDSHGTYFFNSKDLNLISHIQELVEAGVTSLKIEGRNKSVYYVASVVRAYRHVVDQIETKKPLAEIKKAQKWSAKELDKMANRGYTKGFLLGMEPEHAFLGTPDNSPYQFVGEVLEGNGKEITVKVHNALYVGDSLEIVTPKMNQPAKILRIYQEDGEEVQSAHGGHGKMYKLLINKKDVEAYSLVRKVLGK
jgi:putative protease